MDREEALKIVRDLYEKSLFLKKDKEAITTLIPELKESEDERIRKNILALVKKHAVNHERCQMEAYLERQKDEAQKQFNLGVQAGREEVLYEMEKEEKPTEWSEEDEKNLYNTIEAIKYTFDVSEGSGGSRLIAWLKFHLRPQSHWKPSEEQMNHLGYAYTQLKLQKCYAPHVYETLGSLYDDLKKL